LCVTIKLDSAAI